MGVKREKNPESKCSESQQDPDSYLFLYPLKKLNNFKFGEIYGYKKYSNFFPSSLCC